MVAPLGREYPVRLRPAVRGAGMVAKSRRKKHAEEHENQERWLVSYADFITLLFAFFVVMYSISSINESKYRVLSDTLDQAFSFPDKTLDPIQVGEIIRRKESVPVVIPMQNDPPEIDQKLEKIHDLEQQQEQLRKISNQIEEMLSPYIDQDLIEVTSDELWLKVEMKSSLLFASASAKLAGEAIPVLRKIGEIFRKLPNTIHVEGYTDDRPIETREFPSNWELSAGRSASVVSQLVKEGIDPERLAAIGYGEYHPIADNKIEAGREKNRRVVLVLLAQSAARFKWNESEQQRLTHSAVKTPPAGDSQATAGREP
ncbi:MAG: flagellar motor protein MotD [Methylococcaceae bacterium]|nr:flagellar motor protein MotD [Methylococcaceae bacterium]